MILAAITLYLLSLVIPLVAALGILAIVVIGFAGNAWVKDFGK